MVRKTPEELAAIRERVYAMIRALDEPPGLLDLYHACHEFGTETLVNRSVAALMKAGRLRSKKIRNPRSGQMKTIYIAVVTSRHARSHKV